MAAAAAAAVAITAASMALPVYLPEPPPWQADNVRAALAGDVYRVTVDLEVRERCGHVVLDREFVDETEGEVFRQEALRAPFDPRPIVAVDLQPATYRDLVWEYRTSRVSRGVFRIRASFADCPSGFDRTVSLFNAPFDWTPPAAAGALPQQEGP